MMFSFATTQRIYLAVEPVDMRKQFNGLWALVSELTTLIEGFQGILQSDGYAAYEAHAREHSGVTWVACWAHARRKFFEAEKEWPKAVRVVLLIIGWLYECEACWDENKLNAAQRQRHRAKHYPRKLHWLKKLATGMRERVPPKSGLVKWTPPVGQVERFF